MPPGTVPLSIYQGDDYAVLVAFVSVDTAIPIDGYEFRGQIRPVSADADGSTAPLAEFLCEIVDGPGGVLRISIPHAVTEGLPTGKPVRWDLESIDPSGWISTFLAGPVTVTPEVTR